MLTYSSDCQRLALPGTHLGYFAQVQHSPGHHLLIEWLLTECPYRRFTNRGKRFRQQILQRFDHRPAVP